MELRLLGCTDRGPVEGCQGDLGDHRVTASAVFREGDHCYKPRTIVAS